MDSVNKITVLHVRCSNYAGGPETSLLGWLKFMDREKFRPRIFFFEEKNNSHQRSLEVFADNKVDVEILPWGKNKNLFGAIEKLTSIIRRDPPAVLHSHDVRADLVCLIAGRMSKTPVVVSNHAWHAVGFKRWLFEALRGFWLRFADLVVNVSEDTHRETVRRGVSPKKSCTIYSGLDLTPYANPPSREIAKARLGFGADDIVIGNVARMWPEKAIHTLIEAAVRLSPRFPNIRFILVGDGPLEAELRAEVAARSMQSYVRFLGFRKDLVDVMSAFDIFALPSSAEGTPMVVYSAMALGLPVVASAVSGVAEILEADRTGILIRPANVDDLIHALEALLADRKRCETLGAAARIAMESRYSAEKAVREFERFYEGLVALRSH